VRRGRRLVALTRTDSDKGLSESRPSLSWQPSAPLEALRARARMFAQIRAFFDTRGALEVETPILSRAATVDANLESFVTRYTGPGAPDGEPMFLHTSPEFPMKRLLASGAGPIYQICRVFRDGESGRLHNPEFTLLEWYRPGLDDQQLMDEVQELVGVLLGPYRSLGPPQRLTYADAFERHAGLDPRTANGAELTECAERHRLSVPRGLSIADRDSWLDLILTQVVEPRLGVGALCFLYDYPASQASLARIRHAKREGEHPVAERFELYLEGVELANGFHELGNATEQQCRFQSEIEKRQARGQRSVPFDANLIAALDYGLPDCAGVALGLDRLLMLALKAQSIRDVIGFPIDRA
jgi:lysyl-tRNA synthetase class 2